VKRDLAALFIRLADKSAGLGLIVPLLRNVMLQTNLGLAILLLLTACSPEPRWVSVPNGKAGEFIDVSSIVTAGPVRLASIKIVFTTPPYTHRRLQGHGAFASPLQSAVYPIAFRPSRRLLAAMESSGFVPRQ